MKIIVGSLNQTKVKAVTSVFLNTEVTSVEVASNVAAQPKGDEETRQGAINRALNAQKVCPNATSIGLEGGIMYVNNQLYLNNWGALINLDGNVYTAAGARIPLPDSFIEKIEKGMELSEIMNEYTKRNDIRHHEGAIGIFTALHLKRKEMFAQIVTLLKGQMEYK